MAQTSLLPPSAGIRLAWALTGKFPKSEESHLSATYAEAAFKDIEIQAKRDPDEVRYIIGAKGMIFSSLRSLDTIYKGRNLNFDENEKLRSVHLKTIKDNLTFGNKAKDVLVSLPTMTISSAGGVTLASVLGIKGNLLIGLGFILAAVGYLVNVGIVRLMRHWTQKAYIKEDFDRDLYYDQFISRTVTTLISLYLDLDRHHQSVFGRAYETKEDVREIVERTMNGVRATLCKYAQKHIGQNKITPDRWPICETGNKEYLQNCPYWREENGNVPE